MRQWMSWRPVSHQIGAAVAALLASAAPRPAQLQVAPVALPSGLCLPAPHPAPLRLSAALAASSGSQAPLPNPGATRQGDGAVTVLPDAFREPGPPLPNSNLQAARSRLRTPAATLVSFPPTTPQVSTAPRAAWSHQPFPSPCRVTVAGTDLRFCTKNWGRSQT